MRPLEFSTMTDVTLLTLDTRSHDEGITSVPAVSSARASVSLVPFFMTLDVDRLLSDWSFIERSIARILQCLCLFTLQSC